MIVVDADVIAAYWIHTARTEVAKQVRRKDADWVVPTLWQSEFRSVLRQYLVADLLPLGDARWIAAKAEAMLRGQAYAVDTAAVLKLVQQTHHSSYDCEYVALAASLDRPLITGDQRLARLFPNRVVLMEDFVA